MFWNKLCAKTQHIKEICCKRLQESKQGVELQLHLVWQQQRMWDFVG